MAKRRRLKSTTRYIMLHHYVLNSEAWLTLPSNAKALLLHVWQRHNGMNNGEISYAVREAGAIGISPAVASRMFDILIERGFLVVTKDSAFTLKSRMARVWRLTAEDAQDKPSTKEFMSWRAPPK